jgi:Ca2+-binding RTX toxin-like protein
MLGEDGNDTLVGASGADTFVGGAGIDVASYYYETRALNVNINAKGVSGVTGEKDLISKDIEGLEGGKGNDTLAGGTNTNLLIGGEGNDLLIGNDGNDTMRGGGGSDTMKGGNGRDVMDGGSGGDRFIGGNDNDTADYSARTKALKISLDDLTNDGESGEHDKIDNDVEIILGGSGADSITGNDFDNTITGGAGNDTIHGNGGLDSITGGAGLDKIFGEGGADTLVANDGQSDTIDGGADGDVDVLLSDLGLDISTNIP